MSNKNYHNYNSYSSANNTKTESIEPVTEEVVETAVEESVEEAIAEPVEEEVEKTSTEEPVEDPVVEESRMTGIVVNCNALRVREFPSVNADILCTIDVGSEVEIKSVSISDEFYKVCTAAGFEGYCMKKFISVQ